MILSMTGFAASTTQIPLPNNGNMILAISIKSLNSRYFEVTCKVPSLLSNIEVPLQRVLQKLLHRGHVSIHIKILNSDALYESIKPSLQTIASYFDAIQVIQSQFNLQENITLAQILQLPHALQAEELQLNETIEQSVLDAIVQVAHQMIETQKKEGAQLSCDIQEQIIFMTARIQQVQKLSCKIIQDKKDALTQTLSQLSTFEPITTVEQKSTEQCMLETKKSTLMHEIEKLDINEETVRFNSHLISIAHQLASHDALKGKKLDFTIQELNREINTIASKCPHVEISSMAIDIKATLEKVREQAQNII